jgi:hypothetical protein
VPGASAPDTAYLYIVSWDDLRVTQGVLGQFRRGAGAPVYTGGEDWQVCATGIDLSASANGPTQAEVNAQIAICNAGTGAPGTTSRGWVNTVGAVTAGALGTLAIGEPNDGAAGGTSRWCARPRWAASTPPPGGCGTSPAAWPTRSGRPGRTRSAPT